MSRRIGLFVALALALAVVFVRLGFWQLDRLRQRRARNAAIGASMAAPAVPYGRLGASASYRRAIVTGAPDYAHEIILTGRSHDGSPGVYLLTPVRPAGGDSAVVVIRGWVYSPDAATVDAMRWREARDTFTGYVVPLPAAGGTGGTALRSTRGGRSIRALTLPGVRELLPYPVSPTYIVSQDAPADSAPVRLPPPALDDGPHLSYAIQWFSFAAIAVFGAGAVVARARVSPESRGRAVVDWKVPPAPPPPRGPP